MAKITDPIQALVDSANLPSHNFPVTSRYYPIAKAQMDGPDDEPIVYLRRRFVPPPEHYSSQQMHRVADGERLDNVTAMYLIDPEQFWQLADANGAMKPQELTEQPGNILRIPSASGISGF
jgi:hypothetical protein